MAEQMCKCPLLQESGSMLAVPNGPTNAPGLGEEMNNSLEADRTERTQLILRPQAELA